MWWKIIWNICLVLFFYLWFSSNFIGTLAVSSPSSLFDTPPSNIDSLVVRGVMKEPLADRWWIISFLFSLSNDHWTCFPRWKWSCFCKQLSCLKQMNVVTCIYTRRSVSHLLHLGFEKNHTLKQYEMCFAELIGI